MKKFIAVGINDIENIPQLSWLNEQQRNEIKAVSEIYPFRTNPYVLNELINWELGVNDPIFKLNFPHREMLHEEDYNQIVCAKRTMDATGFRSVVNEIRAKLNPHPAGQVDLNIPYFNDVQLNGLQHKYQNTVLFFPGKGQTCHAYCTFCFRWAQFVDGPTFKIRSTEIDPLVNYLQHNKHVTDIIFTGGDPMIMNARILESYILPLLEIETIRSIRIGSKSLSYWPFRYTDDADSGNVLGLFEKIVQSGRHLAFMAHFNHPAELKPGIVKEAIKRIRSTGAEIRTQSPLLKNINNDPLIWKELWEEQVRLGCVPYYMFLARDTGAQHYFAETLSNALYIYREAIRHTSGLCRTVRGPIMSAQNGKVEVLNYQPDADLYTLRFIQHRNPQLTYHCFNSVPVNSNPIWFNDLTYTKPEDRMYFE